MAAQFKWNGLIGIARHYLGRYLSLHASQFSNLHSKLWLLWFFITSPRHSCMPWLDVWLGRRTIWRNQTCIFFRRHNFHCLAKKLCQVPTPQKMRNLSIHHWCIFQGLFFLYLPFKATMRKKYPIFQHLHLLSMLKIWKLLYHYSKFVC